MAMIYGITQAKKHIVVGTQPDVCIVCTEKEDRLQARESVGQLNGKPVFKGTSVKGEEVCICSDCILKLAEEVKKYHAR